MCDSVPSDAKLAAGVLPLFDGGKVCLLGKEYRERYNTHYWMSFGGNVEKGESFAEAAYRECNEETAFTLNISIEKVKESEDKGHYVDYYNDKSNFFYRMYVILIEGEKPSSQLFIENAVGKEHVEKIEWRYFATRDFVFNQDGVLPDTDVKIYPTACIRLKLLQEKEFIQEYI